MAVVAPILDNRTFTQLRDELVRRIATYTPEWTDHNESDPGIALLELFAFLGESLLFRFNQIPDRTKMAFLQLLQLAPRPAEPATAIVAAATEEPAGVQILRGSELKAGSVPFETSAEVYVWPLEVLALGKLPQEDPPIGSDRDIDRQDIARRLGIADHTTIALYESFVLPLEPTDPTAPVLDVSETADNSLWIALLEKDTSDLNRLAGRVIFVGVEMDGSIPGDFDLQELGLEGARPFRCPGDAPSAPALLWEIWLRDPAPNSPPPFARLEIVGDTTRGLTRSGVVAVTLPHDFHRLDPATSPSGGTDSPPPIEDPARAARVAAWLRVTRPIQENDRIGRIRWVGINAVEAIQEKTAPLELIGTGTGEAGQRFRMANANVRRGSAELEVEEPGGWTRWDEVETFVGRGQDDRCYRLDAAVGAIEFGGATRHPQIGERIRVRTYRFGGGSSGNVGPNAITRATRFGNVKVTNPLPARGGLDAEQLDRALERVPDELYRRDRVVTEDDFTAAALEVTGVARAETLGRFHPDAPLVVAAGVVTVMVFPREDRRTPAAPTPDRPMLGEVCAHLDRRRLLTTELYVIPPTYRQIAVAAGVKVRDGYQVDAIRRWVELILHQYLAPVPPGGPEGNGWPLGRTVRRQELEAVAVQVEGVEYLEGLKLARRMPANLWQTVDEVTLHRWEVPTVTAITVVTGPPLEPGDVDEPQTPVEDRPLAPEPKDVC